MRLCDLLPHWEPGMPLPAPAEVLDAGKGMCCVGAATGTPLDCTCWRPVYDLDQAEPRTGVPMPAIPLRMCGDCAYRPRSPERQGDEAVKSDIAELDRLVATGTPFFCHAGMRRPLRWVHPSGAEIPGHAADYRPPIRGGVPYKADGSPGEVCSGWLLRRSRLKGAH